MVGWGVGGLEEGGGVWEGLVGEEGGRGDQVREIFEKFILFLLFFPPSSPLPFPDH